MESNSQQSSQEKACQFFIHLIDEEEKLLNSYEKGECNYEVFEAAVTERISSILMKVCEIEQNNKILGEIQRKNLFLNLTSKGNWLIIVLLNNALAIQPIISDLFDGPGYCDFQLSDIDSSLYTEPEKIWSMWPYLGSVKMVECDKSENNSGVKIEHRFWPPHDFYNPFITANDYKTFYENEDSLISCIQQFKAQIPSFLRAQWTEDFEDDILEIESSIMPIETFNTCIGYPSYEGYSIIDSLFTDVNNALLSELDDDIYTIFGYFYGIHLRRDLEPIFE